MTLTIHCIPDFSQRYPQGTPTAAGRIHKMATESEDTLLTYNGDDLIGALNGRIQDATDLTKYPSFFTKSCVSIDMTIAKKELNILSEDVTRLAERINRMLTSPETRAKWGTRITGENEATIQSQLNTLKSYAPLLGQ